MLAELPTAAVLCPQYRLASNPGGSFPAQLQDAVTAYRHLLDEQKIPAARILVSGDSAGAHIAINLLRYLHENPGLLPLPRALLLHSPWVDLTPSELDYGAWAQRARLFIDGVSRVGRQGVRSGRCEA